MTLEEAENGLYEAIKHVGKQIDNVQFPYKVERILILPKREEGIDIIEAGEILKLFNSSSNSMVKVLRDNGFGKRDFDYFAYSSNGINNQMHITPLSFYLTLS